MRSVILCTIVAFAIVCSASVFENGYFHGRSGDVIISKTSHQGDAFVGIIDDSAFLVVPERINSISELQLASTVSDLLSLPQAKLDEASSPLSSQVFRKPAQTLLVHVEGVSGSVAEGRLLKGNRKLRVSFNSVPEAPVSTLTTLSTGVPPAVHGIVSSVFAHSSGDAARAFDMGAGASVATLGDRLLDTFGSCASVASFGASAEFASAFAPRDSSRVGHSFAFTADVNGRTSSVRGHLPSHIPAELLSLSHLPIVHYEGSDYEVSIAGLAPVTLSLNNADDALLLRELSALHALVSAEKTDSACPRAIAMSFSSIARFLASNADDSARVDAALRLVDLAIRHAAKSLPNSVTLVLAGGRPVEYSSDITERVMAAAPASMTEAFPHVYARSAADAEHLCTAVKNAVRGTEYQAACPRVNHDIYARYQVMASQPGYLVNATNGTQFNAVWQFNIFFFLPLGFVILLLVFVCYFGTAENQRDSLIYRTSRGDAGRKMD